MADALPHLTVDLSRDEGSVTVVAAGEIDAASAPMLGERVREAVAEGPATVALDLGRVSFIDSSGLRAVTLAHRSVDDAGLTFAVVAASEQVRRLFSMTGLDGLLP